MHKSLNCDYLSWQPVLPCWCPNSSLDLCKKILLPLFNAQKHAHPIFQPAQPLFQTVPCLPIFVIIDQSLTKYKQLSFRHEIKTCQLVMCKAQFLWFPGKCENVDLCTYVCLVSTKIVLNAVSPCYSYVAIVNLETFFKIFWILNFH